MSTGPRGSAQETEEWYRDYYRSKGADRNDLLTNPEVLFQHLAVEESVLSALRGATSLSRERTRILDVGSGGGGSLSRFLQLGFTPGNICGIDILRSRVVELRHKYPAVGRVCGSATALPFPSNHFGLVLESTMFVQITDEALATSIASEMLRVLEPGGYVLLIDWRVGRPGDSRYRALSKRRIRALFSVGSATSILLQRPGALVPPIGRVMSRFAPAFYFLLRTLVPFLVGSWATVLQKRS